jgi:hypothetical protein
MDAALLSAIQQLPGSRALPWKLVADTHGDDLSNYMIETRRQGDSTGQWRRHPAAVLGLALGRIMPNGKSRAWLEFSSHEGHQWSLRQQLVFPAIARDPTLLWRPPVGQGGGGYPHGRPDLYVQLDEWTRIPTDDFLSVRGDIGDAGGSDQVAALYWEQGRVEQDDGVEIPPSFRVDLVHAVTGLVSTDSVI